MKYSRDSWSCVSADETETALIAAGCVAGSLMIIAIAVCAFFCFKRFHDPSEKKPLPHGFHYHQPNGYANGYANHLSHQSHIAAPEEATNPRSSNPRLKAFTQHAASPRHRPPVTFYTIRADPRDFDERPGVIPMGPPHPYRAPPTVGRPVFFLDWKAMPNGFPAQSVYGQAPMYFYGL
ncbi:hypothetical protein PoB_005782700 [Plakobranchus ocellatus]|uniref:Uncharacterized protein n=1 Tax=Plakobranchus ocellatus TaxID=259542 RepID=A0AAV4CIY0_9GAST|nr:hypothetical protein PoB_005782700 [Plakobranchus ocellatus]